MALEIRRLVRDDRVGRGVRLVEGVVCEGVNIVVDRLRGALADPVRDAALDAPARVDVYKRQGALISGATVYAMVSSFIGAPEEAVQSN